MALVTNMFAKLCCKYLMRTQGKLIIVLQITVVDKKCKKNSIFIAQMLTAFKFWTKNKLQFHFLETKCYKPVVFPKIRLKTTLEL